jgi:hypothetical protein
MRNKNLPEIRGLLSNYGSELPLDSLNFADDRGAFAYLDYTDRAHRYLVGVKEAGEYVVRVVVVWLGPEGRLVAEFDPEPFYVHHDIDKVLNFIWDVRREQSTPGAV